MASSSWASWAGGPALNDNALVGFDLEAGWATPTANLHQAHDWLGDVVQLGILAVVAVASAGAGAELAGYLGMGSSSTVAGVTTTTLTTGGAMVQGAVVGAASSLTSGVMNDNLTFKGFFTGALSGALTAGALRGLDASVASGALAAGTVEGMAANFAVKSGIQLLLDGKLSDATLLANFAGALGTALAANMEQDIKAAVSNGDLAPGEAYALRAAAKMMGSAVRAMGDPTDPNHAFASALVGGWIQDSVNEAAAKAAAGSSGQPGSSAQPAVNWAEADRADAAASSDPGVASASDGETAEGASGASPVAASTQPAGGASSALGATGSPSADPAVEQIVITGIKPSIDAEGNRLMLDSKGNGMIELAGGGVVRLPGLAPAVVDRLRSPDVLSGSMLLALGGDATSLSLGEVLAGRVAAAVPELAGLPLRAIGLGASLMVYSPAAGLPDINISLGPDLRYVAPESAALGRLEQNVSGQWMPVIANARLYNVMGYTVVLPDEKLGLVIRPLTTPIVDPDPWPGTMLPLPPWANKVELTPPYEMDNNPGPTILTTPGTPVQTAADLIIQNGNAENNREIADQRYQANPNLQDPRKLAGTTVPGVGTWSYPMQPRGQGAQAEYQEQVTGVTAGMELNVAGQPVATSGGLPSAEGGTWFEGWRVEGNLTILVDAKFWGGFVLPNEKFWTDTVADTAQGELDALRAAGLEGQAKIEWPVSTKGAADAIRKVIAVELKSDAKYFDIVEVPKKGP